MKRTWKMFTVTKKRQAIKDVRTLVSKDISVSKARQTVGKALGVTPNTLYTWERSLTGETTQDRTVRSTPVLMHNNGNARPHITSVNLHIPGQGEITLDHELLTNISRLAGFTS